MKAQMIVDVEREKIDSISNIEVVIERLREMGTVSIAKNVNIKELQLELLKKGFVTVSNIKAHENCLKLQVAAPE